uniref:Uncharacterized protein n=1 Tax=Solanum lycopersicum TaxID=4081 RepID=A0A3Q7HZR3_SOLLC
MKPLSCLLKLLKWQSIKSGKKEKNAFYTFITQLSRGSVTFSAVFDDMIGFYFDGIVLFDASVLKANICFSHAYGDSYVLLIP